MTTTIIFEILAPLGLLSLGFVLGWFAACICGVSKEDHLRAAAEQRERFASEI